jgi:hypothetical protein
VAKSHLFSTAADLDWLLPPCVNLINLPSQRITPALKFCAGMGVRDRAAKWLNNRRLMGLNHNVIVLSSNA